MHDCQCAETDLDISDQPYCSLSLDRIQSTTPRSQNTIVQISPTSQVMTLFHPHEAVLLCSSIRLHTPPNLLYNLRCIVHTLRLEIIAFRILLVPSDNNLANPLQSAQHCQSHKIVENEYTYPEGFWMPPTNLTPNNHIKRQPARLPIILRKQRLPCLPRQYVHVLLVH